MRIREGDKVRPKCQMGHRCKLYSHVGDEVKGESLLRVGIIGPRDQWQPSKEEDIGAMECCDVSCQTTGNQNNSPPSSGGIPGYSDSSHRYDHPSTPDWVMDEAKCRLGAVYSRSVARALNLFHLSSVTILTVHSLGAQAESLVPGVEWPENQLSAAL